MIPAISRRHTLLFAAVAASAAEPEKPVIPATIPATFPTQPPELAHEMVGASHANLARVKELVTARPSLAKAAWDWGFGDWETALGAASHVGNREIAELLLANGAQPTIFSAAMLGQLEVVKAFVTAQPGVQRTTGPHSISLLAHARAGKAQAEPVLRYLETLGDAGSAAPSPFSEADAKDLVGTYVFGAGATERIDVMAKGAQLTFKRLGGDARNLIHLGEKAFYPSGASAVRIRFGTDEKGMVLTVHDPNPVLSAVRIAG